MAGPQHKRKSDDELRLPLRWIVILSLGTAAGVAVDVLGGGAAVGIPSGIAAVATLHQLVK